MLSELKNNKLSFAEIEKFRLPIYNRKGKEKYVYFYVLDPESVLAGTPRLRRIRKKFNHIHNKKDRDEAALRFRDEVSIKLKQGWNPLIQECGKRGFTLYPTVLERYTTYLNKLFKDDVIKKKTIDDYKCRLKHLKEYNEALPEKIIYVYQLNQSYIEGFLEHIYIDRNTTPRTRNNYLNWLSSFCSYLKSNGYISENPAEKITPLREKDKQRKPLSETDMKRLNEYLSEHDKDFLLACQIHYYTLIRPNELTFVQINDISVRDQTLFISKEVSKNRKDAKVTIPTKVIKMMIDRGIFSYPGDYYLFGTGFRPNKERSDSRIFREKWIKVREELGFPKSYQFYSLKDTGITDTIDRVGLTIAKDQARHSSVATTNKYVRKEQLLAHPELKNYEGNL
ncbi:tyrosine-type recombinase/integrase [Bacteroides salyersiae]|uniref:tyrosine-type recombinase/integrase n=1 Tax=Bacteroides salyersiae TaxID=291644 RepID=UPI0018997637|nr:phage integrase SAM-like domain-containing protein [Bacteroides salyersiae]